MINDAERLIETARDQVGRDAYVMYENSQRLIPEAVLWAFASACVLEFVKPLIDLKSLGENSRTFIVKFLREWKAKNGFEAFVEATNPTLVVESALAEVPPSLSPKQSASARDGLEKVLIELGMRHSDARRHAAAIAASVLELNR